MNTAAETTEITPEEDVLNGNDATIENEIGENSIKIFVRVKPTIKPSGYFTWDEEENIFRYDLPKDVMSGFVNNSRTTYKFKFDGIIGMKAQQNDVFDIIGKPCILNALEGFNSTIFAYGQTGSGKTFTITGGAEKYEQRGIIPRSISMIFQQIKERQSEYQINAYISYLEIYNDAGYDLLDPRHEQTKSLDDLPKVSMLEDEDGNCHLRNLSMHPVSTEEQALDLLFLGDTNRAVSETAMNLASSRSHCIFTVSFECRKIGSEIILRSKLHLVDLAGSERAHKTGAKGQILKEAKYINTSLHYLELVIVALYEKSTKGRTHIPYRNSMMTSVLRDSLGGNCKTVMIATISAEKDQTEESISTCRFAQRVARVQNDAHLNEELDPQILIQKLKTEIISLKEEIFILKGGAGGNQTDQQAKLTDLEIQKLHTKCENYLRNPTGEPFVIGGDISYIKIQKCFSILKDLYLKKAAEEGGGTGGTSDSRGGTTGDEKNEVRKLKDLLQQRDHEISIMVNMVKQVHKDASIQDILASTTSTASTVSSSYDSNSGLPIPPPAIFPMKNNNNAAILLKELGSSNSSSQLKNELRHIQVTDKSILEDPSKAFEYFKKQHTLSSAIHENKIILKEKYEEAKKLGEKVKEEQLEIKSEKIKIEQLRKERGIQKVVYEEKLSGAKYTENELKIEEEKYQVFNQKSETQENILKQKIEEKKQSYLSSIAKLKEYKTEIQHLQNLLENNKIKLQKDFDLWYENQGKSLLLLQNHLPKQIINDEKIKVESPMKINTKVSTSSKVEDDIEAFNKAVELLKQRKR